jgi:hypothetical protein
MVGHFGLDKTMVILQKHFYWPKHRQDVINYIRYCTSCDISKTSIKNQGLYTPLPTPEIPWESISMDYMSGISSTKKGNDCVFVAVDQFSNMAILTYCKKRITMEDTGKLLFEHMWVHFGIPHTIISIRTTGFSTHFGRVSGHCWTPSSLNPLLSTHKPMAKQRSSIR